jgi:hypothetical protein
VGCILLHKVCIVLLNIRLQSQLRVFYWRILHYFLLLINKQTNFVASAVREPTIPRTWERRKFCWCLQFDCNVLMVSCISGNGTVLPFQELVSRGFHNRIWKLRRSPFWILQRSLEVRFYVPCQSASIHSPWQIYWLSLLISYTNRWVC